jgi:proteasome lid subunit RPN8/RPN11
MARSHPIEIYAFVLGRRLGDLFIGETVFEVNNILQSRTSALPDLTHVFEIKKEVASRFPDLEIVCTCHSHPSGVLWPSKADKLCFIADDHPNIIISPRRLFWGSSKKRLAAFYHNNSGKVRKIKLHEIDKKEIELKDIDIKELAPSKEELLDIGELATEIDFGIYKIWMVSHPNLSLKKLGKKLSEIFGKKFGFVFLFKDKDGEWIYDPSMKVVDFFLKDGNHLVFPEFFKEVIK